MLQYVVRMLAGIAVNAWAGWVGLTFDDGHAFQYPFDGFLSRLLLLMVDAFFFFNYFLKFPTCPILEMSEYW